MATEPPSEASQGGLSCYTHGMTAQRTEHKATEDGEEDENQQTIATRSITFKTTMKAPKVKGKGDKGGKQGQKIKPNTLVLVMEQLAALEMDRENDDNAPTYTRRRRKNKMEKENKPGILGLLEDLQQQQQVAPQLEQQQQETSKPEGNQVASFTSSHWRGHLASQVSAIPIEPLTSPPKLNDQGTSSRRNQKDDRMYSIQLKPSKLTSLGPGAKGNLS